MDYYRRYVGDYLADTQELTLAQDGAYGRLLDYYYAKEQAPLAEKVFEIARATKAADRAAVQFVLDHHFTLESDGRYHNARADKELGIAVPKIEKLREVARENGKKGGRPKKPNPVPTEKQSGFREETESGSEAKAKPVPTEKQPARLNHPPSANHQPPEKTTSLERFPGDGNITPPPAKADGASTPTPDTVAKIIAECVRAKLEDPCATNAIVDRWIRNGATPTQVTAALADARKSMPFPKTLKAGYVDPILVALMDADRTARRQAEAKVERTAKQITAQRESAQHAAAPPDDLMGPYRKRAEAA